MPAPQVAALQIRRRMLEQEHMTTSLLTFGIWIAVTGLFAYAMTAKELDTNRARALRHEDSTLSHESVDWVSALGLVSAVLLCVLAR